MYSCFTTGHSFGDSNLIKKSEAMIQRVCIAQPLLEKKDFLNLTPYGMKHLLATDDYAEDGRQGEV